MKPNSKVAEQEARADRIYQEVYGNKAEQAPEQTTEAEANTAEQATEEVKPEVVEAPPVKQVEDWEHRYRVLQGKYSAEVPRMAEQLRELNQKMQEQEERLKNAQKAQEAVPDLKSMTPEQVVEQFGEDFAAAVGSVAARIAEQHSNKFREEFAPKVEQVQQTAAQARKAEFFRELSAVVPDWQEVDLDAGFTAFLDEVDDLSGKPRRDYFNEAVSENNAARVSKFFLTYKGKSSVSQLKPVQSTRMAIENSITPSNSPKSDAPSGKRYWTKADIDKFYIDQRRGLYTEAEARRVESDLFAAGREGRLAA